MEYDRRKGNRPSALESTDGRIVGREWLFYLPWDLKLNHLVKSLCLWMKYPEYTGSTVF